MARGDIINGAAVVPAGSYLYYQPAAGVEVMIFGWAAQLTGYGEIGIYDGVRHAIAGAGNDGRLAMKLGITNSVYLAIKNTYTTSLQLAYSGVQTK